MGKRVELNALAGREFIDWLEAALDAAGVEKVIPDEDVLVKAYRHIYGGRLLNRRIEGVFAEVTAQANALNVPGDLASRVTAALEDERHRAWDDVIEDRADEDL